MQFLAIDTETMGDLDPKTGTYNAELNCQKFTLGEILKENGKKELFTEPSLMANRLIELIEIERKKGGGGRTFVYGFNTQYDFYAIFRDMLKKSLIIEFENGKIIKYLSFFPFLAVYGKEVNGKFVVDAYICDLMSYFRMSLKELGKIVELEKLEMPMNPKSLEEIEPYLHRDCEITMLGIKKIKSIIKSLGFSPKRYLTAGNSSMTCFLTHCKKNNLSWIFSFAGRTYQGKHINEFRSAFRGGRFECFKTGEYKNCTKIDWNAQYPYIMMNMDFPDLRKEYYSEDANELRKVINEDLGIIRCTVVTPEHLNYGYLPIRIGDKTFYPTGNRVLKGMWTTIELKRALELGYIITQLDKGIYFKKANVNPFKDYLRLLWEKRKISVGVEKEVLKLLMNSLFGKWSQYRTEEDIRIINRNELEDYQNLGFKFLKTAQEKYIVHRSGKPRLPRYANPMISILITALGRDYLYGIMQMIDPNKLIYVATDGLIFEGKVDNLGIKIGKEIGEFKIEDEGTCKILGENRYQFNGVIKLGGIPKKDINPEVFEGRRKVKVSKMISVKQALRDSTLKDKIGTFEFEDIIIGEECKQDIILPSTIIENDRFIEMKGGGFLNDDNK